MSYWLQTSAAHNSDIRHFLSRHSLPLTKLPDMNRSVNNVIHNVIEVEVEMQEV